MLDRFPVPFFIDWNQDPSKAYLMGSSHGHLYRPSRKPVSRITRIREQSKLSQKKAHEPQSAHGGYEKMNVEHSANR